MPSESYGMETLRAWWPLFGAVAGQLLALGGGIVIVQRLRSDFAAHDAKDDVRFKELSTEMRTGMDGLKDRISDIREDIAGGRRHER